MTELDHIREELREMRETCADTQATAARIEERLANFTHAAEERARKSSDAVKALDLEAVARDKALDARIGKLESWQKMLFGAYVALPIAWQVFQALKK